MMNTALSFVNNTLENQSSILFPRPDFESKTDEWVWDQSEAQYQQNTCGIVSRVAYLTGVEKRHFIAPHTRIEYEVYQQLEQNAQARIVRHLSMLRTAINLNFRQIDQAMVYEMKNIHLLPWTKEIVQALQKDGVEMVKANCRAKTYILSINQKMPQYLDRCQELFPEWVVFKYIRRLFLFPNCETKAKQYFASYIQNVNRMPFQVCINWKFTEQEVGNLFQSDQKFLSLLYEQFGDVFTQRGNVHSESATTRSILATFAQEADRIVLIVDCENSDPIKVCAALQSLDSPIRQRLVKVILFNDVNASSCWEMLGRYVDGAAVDHRLTHRVLSRKSLVDTTLVAGVCREFYQNHTDSFLLASSDSDFLGLVRSIPEARFLWLVEDAKVSEASLHELTCSHIPFCYLEQFNSSGSAYKLKKEALLDQCSAFLHQYFSPCNITSMLDYACQNTRIQMSDQEKLQFKKKYLQSIHVCLDAAGNLNLAFGE